MSENYVDKLIKVAENEVGYLEKATNSNLDSKTGNAGAANYTKYSRDLVKWIGSPYSNGVAWCDIFCDYCFITAFGLDEAKKLLGGWSAYTPTSAQYYKNMGRWFISNPQVGDQIFFKNSTRICHTGIVYKVDSTRVYTIEGNTSSGNDSVVANGGCVAKKSYLLTNNRIAGYGRPKYDVKSSSTSTISTITTTVLGKVIATTLNIRSTNNTSGDIVGTYKNGDIVKLLQEKDGWYKTEKGWISGKYINTNITAKVNCDRLNVRKEPKIEDGNVLFLISKDTIVKIIGLSNDDNWIKVAINNKIGWCSAKYIEY